MINSIEPKQITYNSRYMQNNAIDDLNNSITDTSNNQNKEHSKKYLSRFINYNIRSLCPGLTDNVILYGFNAYILNINDIQKTITVLVTPGAVVHDSTLLLLNEPQILDINFKDIPNISKLILVLDFSYNLTQAANRKVQYDRIPTKTSQQTPALQDIIKYSLENSTNIPFSLKLFFVDNSNTVIDSNGLNWEIKKNYLFLAIFSISFTSMNNIYTIDQYEMIYRQGEFLNSIIEKYNIDYTIDFDILNQKITNNNDLDLLSIFLIYKNTPYIVPRLSFFPNDVRLKIINSFKQQMSGRLVIPDIPCNTRRIERFYRTLQFFHDN